MVNITKTYTDYNGVDRTEVFRFDLNPAELTDMELTTPGGFAATVHKIIDTQDQTKLIKTFKDVVLKAYGEKSDDGKYFMKSDEIVAKFVATRAYSDIYMELVTDAKKAADFINGIIPEAPESKSKVIALSNS